MTGAWASETAGVLVTATGDPILMPGVISFHAVVPARGEWSTCLSVQVAVSGRPVPLGYPCGARINRSVPARRLRAWRLASPTVTTPDFRLARTLRASSQDLGALQIQDPDHPDRRVVAAGAPWFMALFGRGSLLTSWMALPLDQQLTLGTLQTLARFQGARIDPLTEADAELHALLPAADRALSWIDTYGDLDGDGFVEYRRATDRGLANQGWRLFCGFGRADFPSPVPYPPALSQRTARPTRLYFRSGLMSRFDKDSVTDRARGTLKRLDSYQQRHPALSVPIAVLRKFVEDESTSLASQIAFWAFFSIFPLLLVFVTLLGYFLPPSLQGDVLGRVASFFPLLSRESIGHLSGEWWTLVLGGISALWSGSFVVTTTQSAFNSVWEIPFAQRPGFAAQIRRSFIALGIIGLGLVVSTMISSYVTGTATGTNLGAVGRIAGYFIAVALDVGLFLAAFRLLTDREIATRDVVPGALLSGVVFWLLQQLSSLIISRYLHTAESTYGNFATVITMLWWFYLQGIVTLLGAQLNVVLKERLHPRGLVDTPATEADYRAYDAYAKERTYHDDERVHTEFPRRPRGRTDRD